MLTNDLRTEDKNTEGAKTEREFKLLSRNPSSVAVADGLTAQQLEVNLDTN
jgi:hypothetical protein